MLCDFVPAIGFGVGFRLRNRFFSLSGNDVRKIRRHDTPVCRRMLNLLGKADLLLATILVVNNLVNIGIVILSSEIIDSLFTFARFEFLFKTVIVTFLLLLFGG